MFICLNSSGGNNNSNVPYDPFNSGYLAPLKIFKNHVFKSPTLSISFKGMQETGMSNL